MFFLQLPVRPAADETAQVTADMPTSATKTKFGCALRELLCDDEAVDDQLSTIFTRCNLLSELVKGLACTACQSSTLAVRAVDCALGVVCTLETHCTSCGEILNITYSYELDPSIDENGIIDITVNYDGTWKTHGFKSMYGLAASWMLSLDSCWTSQ